MDSDSWEARRETGISSMGRGGGVKTSVIPKGRQIRRTLNNIKITVLCGFVTILVLRGYVGINLGTPETDAINKNLVDQTNRMLSELRSDNDEPDDEVINQNSTYILGTKINNWDYQRKIWLNQNPDFPNYLNAKPRMMLVTGSSPGPCDNPIGDHYLLKFTKNKIDYCRLHGIEIVYNMANLDNQLSGYWSKLPLIRSLMLTHPEVEFFWWVDSDALFTDMVFQIPVLKYENYNIVIHGYPELLKQRSWIAVNTGSFLLRNCQWSLDFLDAWARMGPKGLVRDEWGKTLTANLKGRPDFEADDQSALIYLLISRTDEAWMEKVFLENSYCLHGNWAGLVDRYEEMVEKYEPGLGDERWPFVTHFVGCKSCGGSYRDSYSVERCLKSMERAYSFADNQVLNLYGFRHRGLLSSKVKRIRNETLVTPVENVDLFDIRRGIEHG